MTAIGTTPINPDYDSFSFAYGKKESGCTQEEAVVTLYYSDPQYQEAGRRNSKDVTATAPGTSTDAQTNLGDRRNSKEARSVTVSGMEWMKVHSAWMEKKFPEVCDTEVLPLPHAVLAVVAPTCYKLMDLLKVALFQQLENDKMTALKELNKDNVSPLSKRRLSLTLKTVPLEVKSPKTSSFPEGPLKVQKQLEYLSEMSLLQLLPHENIADDPHAKELINCIANLDIGKLKLSEEADTTKAKDIFIAVHEIYSKVVKYVQQIETPQTQPKVLNIRAKMIPVLKLNKTAEEAPISFFYTIQGMIEQLKLQLTLSKEAPRNFLRLKIKGLYLDQDLTRCLLQHTVQCKEELERQEAKAKDQLSSPRGQLLKRMGSKERLTYVPGDIKPPKAGEPQVDTEVSPGAAKADETPPASPKVA